jgi:hydroxymethylpyrimidine/phosphomethylpyrimidine kinase
MRRDVKKSVPIALTIAGSDSGGGAGLQADIKSFSANGVYGASVVTAVTAQNTVAVSAVHEIPADVVTAQIAAVLGDLDVRAIKIGMLFSPKLIGAVAKALSGYQGPVVLDPVMIAKSGDALLQDEAVGTLVRLLISRVDLLTPNLPEAARLLGVRQAQSAEEVQFQAKQILAMGPRAVLMKGGHSNGDICTDLLIGANFAPVQLNASRIATKNTHGTGCTYSAAIAAQLARGLSMVEAVQTAHQYLQNAIRHADELGIGAGHGPVHHFHAIWGR